MQDRPTHLELLGAVERFLEEEAVARLEGPAKYHARVAANVLRIVARELSYEDESLGREWVGLERVLSEPGAPPDDPRMMRRLIESRNRRLSARLRSGEARSGPWRALVLAHLRRTVEDKLEIANPAFLGPPEPPAKA